MSIWSKILVFFVFAALLGLLHATARTLKTLDSYHAQVRAHEAELTRGTEDLRAAVEGNPDQGVPSIVMLKVAVNDLLAERGRVWVTDPVAQVDAAAGTASFAVSNPSPHQILQGMVLFVFDDAELAADGRYLGEFTVTAVADVNITLTATRQPLSPIEQQTLAGAVNRAWHLHDLMPGDSYDILADLPQDQLLALLPPPPQKAADEDEDFFARRKSNYDAFIRGFVRDGKDVETGDPDDKIVWEIRFNKNDDDAAAVLEPYGIPREVLGTGEPYVFEKELAEVFVNDRKIADLTKQMYRRDLIDFNSLFLEFALQYPLLQDRINFVRKDLEYMTGADGMSGAVKDAQNQIVFTNDEVANLKAEVALLQQETARVVARRSQLTDDLAQVTAFNTTTLADNRRLAARIGQIQRAAAARAEAAIAAEAEAY